MHLEVNPELHGLLNIKSWQIISERNLTHWHSPHEIVKGETTLSPTVNVEYSGGRSVALLLKLVPRATTSPTNSCPVIILQ